MYMYFYRFVLVIIENDNKQAGDNCSDVDFCPLGLGDAARWGQPVRDREAADSIFGLPAAEAAP